MITSFTREPTQQCTKCGLEYKVSYSVCPHCVGKNKAQIIKKIHIPHNDQIKKNSALGRKFIYFAIITACCLLLII